MATPAWPETIAVGLTPGFPLWFQGHCCSCLLRPLPHGGDPKRPLVVFSWLWYPSAPGWRGFACEYQCGCHGETLCGIALLSPIEPCGALASVSLGYLSDSERLCRLCSLEPTLQSAPCSRLTAWRCLVKPLWQPAEVPCELAPGEGTPRVAHPVWWLVLHAWPPWLLAAVPVQDPSSRQPLLWLSQRRWLRENSPPGMPAVATCSRSTESASTGVRRSRSPGVLAGGASQTPGFVRGVPRSSTPCLASSLALLAWPVHPRWPLG